VTQWIVGVDEAGRGPLAGPVSVGIVAVPEGFDVATEFAGVRDSKLLTEKKREEIYKKAVVREQAGDIRFCVRFSDNRYIDEFSITRAVRRAVCSGVRHLAKEPADVFVMLDGLLQAPQRYEQHTIINGDALVPVISLASVIAKVRRDRLMRAFAKKYPQYGFERHKGYGTKRHLYAIGVHGLCAIHRRTYCKMFKKEVQMAAES